ncbi:MAG: oxygen-dependent coproporphyrinogen oxidase [Deltaproteobacteria bacterium]|nr:MAG: oxygen-dependent coproporphyrinogen oxidase [Deltaproteobacteria bacterium]
MTTLRTEAQEFFRDLRDRICARLEELDGGKFQRTKWERPGGGGGEMSELRGQVFEKGGCNFSAVWGDKYPAAVDQPATPAQHDDDAKLGIRPPTPAELAGKPFFATGISLVLHPRNPFVPVVHMNVRYLEAGDVSWFGGGTDLTPCREFVEDTRHFHRVLQKVCNAHGPGLYDRFSRWAKEYFFIGHRGSERGVGGIFFDYLRGEERWSFVRDVGEAFLPAYAPLVERRRATPYSDEDRAQQLSWRGRYVEFNLIYDRGTLFGLRTGGNVEAIFMSLPPLVAW